MICRIDILAPVTIAPLGFSDNNIGFLPTVDAEFLPGRFLKNQIVFYQFRCDSRNRSPAKAGFFGDVNSGYRSVRAYAVQDTKSIDCSQ